MEQDWQTALETLNHTLMSVSEAADYLNLSPRQVRRLVQQKQLWSVAWKNNCYILAISVENYRQIRNRKNAMHSLDNLYQGVNPHYMSLAQTIGGSYRRFHDSFVHRLADHLNEVLPAHYRAYPEDNLNILRPDNSIQTRYPDTSIRPSAPTATRNTPVGTAIQPDFFTPLTIVDDREEVLGVAIYQLMAEAKRGNPVVVIEVLSPTNKIGQGAREYQDKRFELLWSGLVLVEIDFLHETPSPIAEMPRYPEVEDSKPYYLAVSDPLRSDQTAIYRFRVNQPIPTILIPLLGEDVVRCNFDEVYQITYRKGFFGDEVDYRLEPPRIGTYSPTDQELIRAHMQTLAQNSPQG